MWQEYYIRNSMAGAAFEHSFFYLSRLSASSQDDDGSGSRLSWVVLVQLVADNLHLWSSCEFLRTQGRHASKGKALQMLFKRFYLVCITESRDQQAKPKTRRMEVDTSSQKTGVYCGWEVCWGTREVPIRQEVVFTCLSGEFNSIIM